MYLFKTRNVCNVIYCQCFLKAFGNRHGRLRSSIKKGVLKNFAKFTGQHLRQSLYFNKFTCLRPATLSKKRLRHRRFPVNSANF